MRLWGFKPETVGWFHNLGSLPVPGSEGGCGQVLIQLGESTTRQSTIFRYPAHLSGQNVAPGHQVTCVAAKGVRGGRLGFPSACLYCDLSSAPHL